MVEYFNQILLPYITSISEEKGMYFVKTSLKGGEFNFSFEVNYPEEGRGILGLCCNGVCAFTRFDPENPKPVVLFFMEIIFRYKAKRRYNTEKYLLCHLN